MDATLRDTLAAVAAAAAHALDVALLGRFVRREDDAQQGAQYDQGDDDDAADRAHQVFRLGFRVLEIVEHDDDLLLRELPVPVRVVLVHHLLELGVRRRAFFANLGGSHML